MVGHEVFISQMKDQIRIFQKQNRLIMTYFLTISEQAILQNMVPKNICVVFDGGYENAERKIACFIPEGYEGFSDCVCLHATYNSKFKTLTHSDLLGCLMHSGIERSVIGDLIVQEDVRKRFQNILSIIVRRLVSVQFILKYVWIMKS